MSRFIVGLRGGIGTGKSTVSELFEDLGVVIADADISARTVVQPGKAAYKAIVKRFGKQVVNSNKTLNRAALRDLVFSDPENRVFVEKQTHGPIIDDLLSITTKARSDYAILVLSAGIGKNSMMQRLLVIDATEDNQIRRVMRRDKNSRKQAQAIMSAQPGREAILKDADDIVINNKGMDHLKMEVAKLHRLYSSLAGSQSEHG
jgi:dephospho-CoA kinase